MLEKVVTYLSILEDEESHILSMVDLIPPEDGRGIVLDPHSCQLVSVDVVALKSTLCMIVDKDPHVVCTGNYAL